MNNLIRSIAASVLTLVVAGSGMAAVDNVTPQGGFVPMGTAKFWANSGGRSIRHARDYSQGFQAYARHTQPVVPQLARQEAAGLGHNIVVAQAQFGELRKATTDKATLASIDAIDKLLGDAAKAHAQMDKMCKMDVIDGALTMKCCQDVDAALNKALAEYEKLSKGLDAAGPTAPPSK